MTYSNPFISALPALPSYAYQEGLMIYVDSNDANQGLYISNGTEWQRLNGGYPLPVITPTYGSVDLVNGTALVEAERFDENSLVVLSYQKIRGTPGILSIVNELPGVGFDILSTSPTDTSKVVYQIFEATPSESYT